MNISSLLALRSLKKNKLRTISTAAGIILSALLMTAIVVLVMSLLSSLIVTTIKKSGNWHFYTWEISDTQVNTMLDSKKVEKIGTSYHAGYSIIQNPINQKKPYIQVNAVSMTLFEMLPVRLLEGNYPKKDNEVLIPSHLKNEYGEDYKIGNSITLNLGLRYSIDGNELTQNSSYLGIENEFIQITEESKVYEIVGICEPITFIENDFSPGYTVLTYDVNQNYQGKKIYFRLHNPKMDFYDITQTVSESNIVYNNDLLSVLGVIKGENFGKTVTILSIALILIVSIASFTLINSSFKMSTSERVKQYALLFSIGATKKQVAKTVLFEALFMSVIFIPIGIAAGIGVVFLSINSIGKMIAGISYLNIIFKININIYALLGIAFFGVLLVVLSALLPALKSARKTPVTAIRQNDEIYFKAKKPKKPKYSISIEGELVLKNFCRFNTKYRYIIFSLIFSTVLFISAGSYCNYAQTWLYNSAGLLGYDIVCNSYESDVYKTIDTIYKPMSMLNGVDESGWFANLDAGFMAIEEDNVSEAARSYYAQENVTKETVQYIFVDDARFDFLVSSLNKDNSLYLDENTLRTLIIANLDVIHITDDKYITQTIDIFEDNTVQLDLFYMNKANREEYYKNPDADYSDYSRIIPITADVIDRKDLLMELSCFRQSSGIFAIIPIRKINYFAEDMPEMIQMYFKAKNHRDVYDRMKVLASENNWDVFLDDVTVGYEMQENMIAMVDIFSKIFIILISVIMALNVFNTVISNMLIRNREFAVLRSVGMSKRSFYKMMFYECILFGGISIGIGLILSIIVSFVFKFSFSSPMNFILPINNILISVFGIIFILILTTLYAARKVLSNNIIESIKTEIT